MELNYFGPGACTTFPIKDKTGREVLVIVLKYSFRIGMRGEVELDEDTPSEPLSVDEHYGDPGKTSIRKPSDLSEEKPGTDVLLVGHAYPSRKHPRATSVDVSLRMGPIAKTLRVHGLRVWQEKAFGGITPGPSRPLIDPIPLLWELAWGGLDLSDPKHPLGEPGNTLGRGVRHDPEALVDQPAALIEYPDAPIGSGKNVPAGFGALCRHWQPRAAFAGTFDETWQQTKMPLLPDDFNPRFHVTAPMDQWSPVPLRGDEPVEIIGATPDEILRFQLPRMAPGFSAYVLGQRKELRTHLDTVWIDADARRVELTYRAALAVPKKYEMIDQVLVFEKDVLSRSSSGDPDE